jgi:hypothetical protein
LAVSAIRVCERARCLSGDWRDVLNNSAALIKSMPPEAERSLGAVLDITA